MEINLDYACRCVAPTQSWQQLLLQHGQTVAMDIKKKSAAALVVEPMPRDAERN